MMLGGQSLAGLSVELLVGKLADGECQR